MKGAKSRLRGFLHDERAVSEEFSSLPALSVVMIGFTLFIVLLANTYSAYHARMDQLEKYQTADIIATKLINPSCEFIDQGVVDYPGLSLGIYDDYVTDLRQEYQKSDFNFVFKLRWDTGDLIVPEGELTDVDRIAVTRDISIRLNVAEIVPGKLTVMFWEV